MITESLIWFLLWCIFMLMRSLDSPFLAILSWFSVWNKTSVSIAFGTTAYFWNSILLIVISIYLFYPISRFLSCLPFQPTIVAIFLSWVNDSFTVCWIFIASCKTILDVHPCNWNIIMWWIIPHRYSPTPICFSRSCLSWLVKFTVFPSLGYISSVAPNSLFTIWVSAVIVVTKSLVWFLLWCIYMLMRSLVSPFHASFSWLGSGQTTSVSITFGSTAFFWTKTHSWGNVTVFPSLGYISSVAPDSFFTIWVSAVIVVTKSHVWFLLWCIYMILRSLDSPFLASFSWPGSGYTTSVSITFGSTAFFRTKTGKFLGKYSIEH